jgi:putative ABC transport system ATP-binding protein
LALIEVRDVSKSFVLGGETIQALDRVSFDIHAGDLICLVGPSGSGKSTLMNILGLLDLPEAGTYRLDGNLVSSLSDDELAHQRNQKLGFVFQSFHLLPRASALRNVEMPLVYSASYDRSYSDAKIREMATEALVLVGLGDRLDHKPNELSGGQRQRVAIARALVNRPRLLLADEPTGNLDSKSGKEILALFKRLNDQGVTVAVVTHDPTIAAQMKRVLSVRDGQIQEIKPGDPIPGLSLGGGKS